MARPKRKDKTRTVLRTGELQRSDGSYQYSWTDENHKRRYVYSKTLEALRIKEEAIEKDKSDGIKAEARYVTLDDLYELWKDLKRGLKTTLLRITNIFMKPLYVGKSVPREFQHF